MQPKPSADTVNPVLPSVRVCIVFSVVSPSAERHTGHLGESGQELVLKPTVRHCAGGGLRATVMPVAAADRCRTIIADRKPGLSEISLFEIVRRSRPAHLRRHPAGIDRIAQYV